MFRIVSSKVKSYRSAREDPVRRDSVCASPGTPMSRRQERWSPRLQLLCSVEWRDGSKTTTEERKTESSLHFPATLHDPTAEANQVTPWDLPGRENVVECVFDPLHGRRPSPPMRLPPKAICQFGTLIVRTNQPADRVRHYRMGHEDSSCACSFLLSHVITRCSKDFDVRQRATDQRTDFNGSPETDVGYSAAFPTPLPRCLRSLALNRTSCRPGVGTSAPQHQYGYHRSAWERRNGGELNRNDHFAHLAISHSRCPQWLTPLLRTKVYHPACRGATTTAVLLTDGTSTSCLRASSMQPGIVEDIIGWKSRCCPPSRVPLYCCS